MDIKKIQDIDNWEILFTTFIKELANEDEKSLVYLNKKWQEKIIKYGEILVCFEKQTAKIIGWILIYCNDEKTLISYCAGFNMLKDYRGKGLGKKLLTTAVTLCKRRKFKTLTLYCDPDNSIAFNMYKSFGFKETSTLKNNLILMILEL